MDEMEFNMRKNPFHLHWYGMDSHKCQNDEKSKQNIYRTPSFKVV